MMQICNSLAVSFGTVAIWRQFCHLTCGNFWQWVYSGKKSKPQKFGFRDKQFNNVKTSNPFIVYLKKNAWDRGMWIEGEVLHESTSFLWIWFVQISPRSVPANCCPTSAVLWTLIKASALLSRNPVLHFQSKEFGVFPPLCWISSLLVYLFHFIGLLEIYLWESISLWLDGPDWNHSPLWQSWM